MHPANLIMSGSRNAGKQARPEEVRRTEVLDVYWERSPLKDVHRHTTPTLFLVGEEDPRVPTPQSVEMFRAVRHDGVPTHLLPGARGGARLAGAPAPPLERWVRDRDHTWEEAPATPADGRGARGRERRQPSTRLKTRFVTRPAYMRKPTTRSPSRWNLTVTDSP